MKTGIISILLILTMLLVPVGSFAEAAEAYSIAMAGIVGDTDDFDISYIGEAAIAITQYTGNETNLILPEVDDLSAKIDSGAMNLKADAIDYQAFAYNTALQTLVIPEGYLYINEAAFYGCENLTTIVLPSTLVSISYESFANCTNLQNVIFPKGSFVTYIDETAFDGCSQMKMTEEEINALIDTSIYEEAEAKAKQQAAFVVDESALTELAGYLATDMDTLGAMIDGSEWRDSDRWGYSTDDLSITSVYSWNYVEEIEIRQKCNYSLCGVYASMNAKEARNLLMKSGWKLEHSFEDNFMFVDKPGNYLSCYFNENDFITSVWLALNPDTAYALSENTYDGSPVIFLPESNNVAISDNSNTIDRSEELIAKNAHSTDDVNMRTGAGREHNIVCIVPANASVEYIGDSATDDRGVVWYHIRYNGNTGWCSSKYIEIY